VNRKPRLVLFGTPDFAARCFKPLLESSEYEVPFVVCQPDKPVGRGLTLASPPVKELALIHDIPVFQPSSLKGISLSDGVLTTSLETNSSLINALNKARPIDLFVVVAYGKIIPPALLHFPSCAPINVHGSLLPRWRGAAPVHRALAAGDTETGVGIMRLEEGLDTGPVYAEACTKVTEEDNFLTLHDRLADLGRDLLLRTIPGILSGSLEAQAQIEEGITYAEKWQKDDLEIRWNEPLQTTLNRIRASSPFPGARTTLAGSLIKIFAAEGYGGAHPTTDISPGTVVETTDRGIVVQVALGERVVIREMQLPGKKRLPAIEIVRGRGIKVGDRFGE